MGEDRDTQITPEKQLLKLIEDPSSRTLNKAKGTYRAKSVMSVGFLKSLGSFFARGGGGLLKGRGTALFDIQSINVLLRLCILGIAAYLILYVTSSIRELKETPDIFLPVVPIMSEGVDIPEVRTSLRPQSQYEGKVDSRDIFNPYKVKKKAAREKAPATAKKDDKPRSAPGVSTFIQTLNLVGIAWGSDPDVIIESTKVKRTFFLKEGDTFLGARVKKIYPDKAVIDYGGEERELL